ncbi:glycoside hydrolase family 3 C-terminal domain-containing protein [Flindersiella endophytica]
MPNPDEQRVEEILGQLTLEEKIGLLHQHQPAIERRGLPEFHTGQEGLHGLAWSGEATVFPQAIGLGSTWNPELVRAIGVAVGREIRACHHSDRPQVGLNVWAPVVDLLRDPRAGRNEEGYSEDPYLTGVLSTAYCEGLSHENATAPTLKHFLAYNNEHERVTTSSDVRPRLLHEYYLRAFEPAIRSGAAKAVMLSYNLVNGRPNHVSPYITEVLRTWSPDLVVVSDAFAPTNLAEEQGYFETHEESHAAALHAGLDSFTDRGDDPAFTTTTLRNALHKGLLDESTIDAAVRRLLRMRLHLDTIVQQENKRASQQLYKSHDHQALAREAVRQSIVLLNNDAVLPLDATHLGSVAVLGPLADDCLTDWYSGTLPYAVTPLDALRSRLGDDHVSHHAGVDQVRFRIGEQSFELDAYDWGDGVLAFRAKDGRVLTRKESGDLVADQDQPNGWVVHETFRLHGTDWLEHLATETPYPINDFELVEDGVTAAAEVARQADVAIVVVGNHPMVGARETADRSHLDLPTRQFELVKAVLAHNPRTVLVVESSYPYALDWADVPASLWLSHGGQEIGNGLADVLLGDVSPSGRLTQTWLGSSAELEAIGGIGEYDIIETGRTYLYQYSQPLYAFGHGLSYTRFSYAGLRWAGGAATVTVTNAGDRAAAEVVQFYVRRASPSNVRYPAKRLAGSRRIELLPGETAEVSVDLESDALAHWDVRQHRFVVETGTYELLAGGSSANLPVAVTAQIDGEPLPPRDATQPIAAVDFDAQAGVRFVPRTPLVGDALTVPASGWICFHDVDFATAATTFVVSGRFCDHSRMELRLGDLTGEPLATIEGSAPDSSTTIRTSIPATTGQHDLYLSLAGGARISQFWFEV